MLASTPCAGDGPAPELGPLPHRGWPDRRTCGARLSVGLLGAFTAAYSSREKGGHGWTSLSLEERNAVLRT